MNQEISQKLLCPVHIIEEVRLWFEEENLFVWSCVEGGHGSRDHDEAILVALGDTLPKKDLLKSGIDKFVSQELLSIILSDRTSVDLDHQFNYTCPSNPHYIVLIVIAVFAFVILGVCCNY